MALNDQKIVSPSAAARLAMLPLVRSACATLSVLYTGTKLSHPSIKSVCELLENSVTAVGSAACSTVSPVIVKLEPQISIANNIACKSLDWLETSFPVLLSPTDQVVAAAKNKMHVLKDVASTAVQHTAFWVMIKVNQDNGKANLVERAVSVAGVGLDSALSLSETLIDQILPPPEGDEEEEKEAMEVESCDVAKVRGRYPERLVSLATKLYRRTSRLVGSKFQSVQAMEGYSSPSAVIQTSWKTLMGILQVLHFYLQHQALFLFSFAIRMYHWRSPSFQRRRSNRSSSRLNANSAQGDPHVATPHRLRKSKLPMFSDSTVKGSMGH